MTEQEKSQAEEGLTTLGWVITTFIVAALGPAYIHLLVNIGDWSWGIL